LRKNGEQIWVENDSTKRSVRNNDCVWVFRMHLIWQWILLPQQ
jgi:hypothetical protein